MWFYNVKSAILIDNGDLIEAPNVCL